MLPVVCITSQFCCQPWKWVVEHVQLYSASSVTVSGKAAATMWGRHLFCSELLIVPLYYLGTVSNWRNTVVLTGGAVQTCGNRLVTLFMKTFRNIMSSRIRLPFPLVNSCRWIKLVALISYRVGWYECHSHIPAAQTAGKYAGELKSELDSRFASTPTKPWKGEINNHVVPS